MDKVEESVASVLTSCCSQEVEEQDPNAQISPPVDVIEWEQFHNSLAHLCGLATVLSKARSRREETVQKLESIIQAKQVHFKQVVELETLQNRIETRRKFLDDITSRLDEQTHQLRRKNEAMSSSATSLLHAARNVTASRSRLQEAQKLLAGEAGYTRLSELRSLLTARRRIMAAQVAALYPLVPCTNKKKCPPLAHAGEATDSTPLTIAGLHVIAPVQKEASLFTDKREYETSATALGYVAHIVSLLARFLDVRLRYPIRYRASRSYIQDFLPPVDASTSGGALVLPAVQNSVVEFPLFSNGQDPTRAAYAVFLLNKDLEQILYHLNANSAGPRHILPNLKTIFKAILRSGQLLA